MAEDDLPTEPVPFDQDATGPIPYDPADPRWAPMEGITAEEGDAFIAAATGTDEQPLLDQLEVTRNAIMHAIADLESEPLGFYDRFRTWFELGYVLILSWFVFLSVVTISVVWIRWLFHK